MPGPYREALDSGLTSKQIAALRFAADEEFGVLTRDAAEKGMVQDEIKHAIRQQPDTYRI